MSLYFDLILYCDLREDISDDTVAVMRCLTDRNYDLKIAPKLLYPGHGNLWDGFYDKHFLAPDPKHEIISNFQRKHRLTIPTENNREVHRYSLQYVGRWLHDDFFYEHHIPFVHWLATVSHDLHLGYYMETNNLGGTGPKLLQIDIVTNKLKDGD